MWTRRSAVLVCAVLLCGPLSSAWAVYGVPIINTVHAGQLERLGRYAQAAQERELAVDFYRYVGIPQFTDDLEFFLAQDDAQRAKFCEITIAGFQKSMQESQKKLEENLAKAELTPEQIRKYRTRNRMRLLASAKLYPVMHNGQMGIDLGELEKRGRFADDFRRAAEGRERSARMYENLTVAYLTTEAAVIEEEGDLELAAQYREAAASYQEKAREAYATAEEHRARAESLSQYDDFDYVLSALEDDDSAVRLRAVAKLRRDLSYIGLLRASQSGHADVSEKAQEALAANEALFAAIGAQVLVDTPVSGDASLRETAIAELERIAHTDLEYDPAAEEADRSAAIARWQGWMMAKLNPGLVGIYYGTQKFDDEVLARTDRQIAFSWDAAPAEEVPSDKFSVRWVGKLKIPRDGLYTLSFENDDGVRVWLGETLNTMEQIALDWSEYGYGGDKAHQVLSKGMYDIRIEFLENKKEARLQFTWNSKDGVDGIVPAENLFHIEL